MPLPVFRWLLVPCVIAVAVDLLRGRSWRRSALVIVLFFWIKSRWEDTLLHEEYGAPWEAWARTTGGLVPRPHRRREAT